MVTQCLYQDRVEEMSFLQTWARVIKIYEGRTILDAVRTIDIFEYTQRRKINGVLVAIDFKKAFDSFFFVNNLFFFSV